MQFGELGAHVEFQSGAQVREQLRSPLYFSGLHYPRGFSLHSLNYALGLAAAAERCGARIYENTAALEIICDLIAKHLRPEQVTLDQAVRLATSRPLPAGARSGAFRKSTPIPSSPSCTTP